MGVVDFPSLSAVHMVRLPNLSDGRATPNSGACPGDGQASASSNRSEERPSSVQAVEDRDSGRLSDCSVSPSSSGPVMKTGELAGRRLFSSPPHALHCRGSACEDDDDHGVQFFTPRNDDLHDFFCTDIDRCSPGNDNYSFKSVPSSPLESPTLVTRDHTPEYKRNDFFHQDSPFRTTPTLDSPDIFRDANGCSNEIICACRENEQQPTQQPPDFEKNSLIWHPPPPEYEDDDLEPGLFRYDEDDEFMDSNNIIAPCNSIELDMLPFKETANEAHKESLRSSVTGHFRALVAQLLKGEGVSLENLNCDESWLDIVSSLAWQAASFVQPDTKKGGSMDPSDYVKVKCVASGSPSESIFVRGIVCSKNVKHKRMVSQYKNAKLLLLEGALEYQKVSHKLASINTVLEQESEHLKAVVAKIEARRPNVLLVEKSASSYAQELLPKDVSLVLNVKRSLLDMISRCTGAQIASSVENITSVRLGQCGMFKVEKVLEFSASKKSTKTLMFFEGCPKRLGCTILLRGTCEEELKKVKRAVQLAVFAAYHLSVETSFLADEGASLPEVPTRQSSPAPSNTNELDIASRPLDAHLDDKQGGNGIPSSSLPNESIFGSFGHKDLSSSSNCLRSSDLSCLCLPVKSLCSSNESSPGLPSGSTRISEAVVHCGDSPSCFDVPLTVDILNGHVWKYGHVVQGQVEDSSGQLPIYEVERADTAEENDLNYLSSTDNHQSILVSLTSTCIAKGMLCEGPQLLRIKFYGSFDKPLGKYLRDDVLDQTNCCPVCKGTSESHARCYTHQHGSLTISVKRLHSGKLSGEQDGRIWMWHRCLKCKLKDGVPPATCRVVMSDAAWGLSFGKFLELSFSNHATANRVASCGHSLQKDCLRFYGFGNMVAYFRYSPVNILSVNLPPSVLDFTCQIPQEWVTKEATAIYNKVEYLHTDVCNMLANVEKNAALHEDELHRTSIHKHITEMKDCLKMERNEYDVLLKSITDMNNQLIRRKVDVLEINRLKRGLLIDMQLWDHRLYCIDSMLKTKNPIPNSNLITTVLLSDTDKKGLNTRVGEEVSRKLSDESITKLSSCSASPTKSLYCDTQSDGLEHFPNNFANADIFLGLLDGHIDILQDHLNFRPVAALNKIVSSTEGEVENEDRSQSLASVLSDKIDLAWSCSSQLLFDRSKESLETNHALASNLTDYASRRKDMAPIRIHSFDATQKFRQRELFGLTPSSLHQPSLTCAHSHGEMMSLTPSPNPCIRRAYSTQSHWTGEKLNIALPHRPAYLPSASHIINEGPRLLLLQKSFEEDIVVAVYDDEPSSIIAYAMNSRQYNEYIARSYDASNGIWDSNGSHFSSYGHDGPPLVPEHFRISFDDDASLPVDKTRYTATCYFAKQFDDIRKVCCPKGNDFIRSLSRCKNWSPQGGKSNVSFAKTADDRFVIKQVTKAELESFEVFAAQYFKYLKGSLTTGSPTCLAKIVGIYQVSVKNLRGGREVKMDFMVMENVFFARKISRVYDLKGSLRSRYNTDTGENKVLLDMNLLEALHTKPIFLGSRAKRILERAIWNDTSFLGLVDVMDYSLLVGVDEEKNELVVGIIDYLRQYTWDKQLETWVKASGILGGPKNEAPTVISPMQYKKRFRKQMSKYFLTVPD